MPINPPKSPLTFEGLSREARANGLNPNRIRIARKRRGLTKIELAAKIGVDRKSVNAYESGKHSPVKEDGLAKIAAALGFPEEFFFGDDLDEPSLDSGSFRSMSKMSAPKRDMALGQAAIGLHFSAWLDRKFGLPDAAIPDIGREPDPETAAESVRREWALGALSIRNMVHLLESKGVRVFSLAVDAREVDAFSMWKGATPFVFLNTNKSSEHSRFDAAHELGHLVLHKHGPPQGIEAEKQANSFASAFLMPRGSVYASAPRFPTYAGLVSLKKQWTVSVAALAYRLQGLKLMTEWQYRGICIEISKRGRNHEPNSAPRETSVILPKVLKALYESGLTRSQIARELSIPLSELEQLLFGLTMTGMAGGGQRQFRSSPAGLSRIK
jgi:Zn-dependent peptidase ImmA (M78 family)/DNA-binding XRE family transcriptional regulator